MEVLKPIQPTMRIATAYKYHTIKQKCVFRALRRKEVIKKYAQEKKQALKRIPPFKTRKGELKL